ncbi:uncharacterized protein LOC110415253 [Herrania umbratica]|uniref:Uncharacterized protein LOC110415253 n=1 Tax=Herrania umbratica TaxID=108875 RepID=A0A6J1A6N9_9ROSI|nr:uncharacterized protein LOC110415253 [Herrania umbratica]XP_021282521.1 uncharacterized protein LOC110415253 [Herrania umbratica]
MVKSKQRQLATKHANKTNAQSGSLDSLNPNIELDLLGEDGWVIVKKQRVTILIPPLPVATKSKITNQGPGQLEAMPGKEVEDQPRLSVQTCPKLPSGNGQEKSTSSAHRKGIEITRSPPQHILTLARSPAQGVRAEPEIPSQVVTLKSHNIHRVPEASKTIRRPRSMHSPSVPIIGSMLLNRRLRVSNLERKLQQAGGLSRWLTSLGLGQFVRIFQAKSVNKFQLVNLNMQKLKDMGADAVGPRRKLIHAIDCVCQPFCFEAI